MRRSTFTEQSVTYGAVGGTQAPDLLYYPPNGYRPVEREARLGSGHERFLTASRQLLTWSVQRNIGMRVDDVHEGEGPAYHGVVFDEAGVPATAAQSREEAVFDQDGTPFVANGMTAKLTIRVWPFTVSAPVRVVYVFEEPARSGFAYGTLPGHPLSGEESFVVEHRDDDSVWLVVRTLSRPSNAFYRLLSPALRVQQSRIITRYLRALLPARAV